MNNAYLVTLEQIREHGPCSDGWTKLLKGLGYANGAFDPDRKVSIGDVAQINGADDALWCLRVLDFNDIEVRRAAVRAILPSVKRVSVSVADQRVHDCIAVIDGWLCGKNTDTDLRTAAAEAAEAAWAAAAWSAAEAAWAAAAWSAAEAARAATWAAARAAWVARAERAMQVRDIIAVFGTTGEWK